MKKKLITTALALLSAFTVGYPAAASASYPDKPITLIIGFSPGGPTDSIGRVLFKAVSEVLKQPIVIENRPGAGGTLGSQALIQAKPDGYTLMYATSSITTAPDMYNRKDLIPANAFVAAGCTASVPLILLTKKQLKINTAKELFDLMKKEPTKLFRGSSGNGSIDHLVGLDIAKHLHVEDQHVPYKGNGPALLDLVAGNIDFMYSGAFNSAMPFIKEGRVNALAVTSAQRSPQLPDVPTISETVLPGFDGGTWQVLVAPKGTSPDILKTLDGALKKALKNPEVLANLKLQGATVMDDTPQECQAFIDKEYARWSSTIRELNLKIK